MAESDIQKLDPETEFLVSKRKTGNEWETFKENVRPLKRGRNVTVLNQSLKSHTDNHLKKSLLDHRRKMVEAIDEYKGEDPLLPWLQCIKWVQEAFPPGGDSSGLVVIYEQCVRAFWHSDRYKDDLRYLKVWLEYVDNCFDADVIYAFLDANGIGKTHSDFYISYGLHLESKNKLKAANQIFELGISRNAQPIDKLKAAYRKFMARSMARPKATDDTIEKAPVRSFGTVLAKGENRRCLPPLNCDPSAKNDSLSLLAGFRDRFSNRKSGIHISTSPYPLGGRRASVANEYFPSRISNDTPSYYTGFTSCRTRAAPLSIYKDSVASTDDTCPHQPDVSNSWHILGARAERNKENNAIPSKWKSYKIPQRPGTRMGGATASARIPVFVDEECQESQSVKAEVSRPSSLQLRQEDEERQMKRETELLRKNPLRNFPHSSLPR